MSRITARAGSVGRRDRQPWRGCAAPWRRPEGLSQLFRTAVEAPGSGAIVGCGSSGVEVVGDSCRSALHEADDLSDPSESMPRYGTWRYVREWVAVKLRWPQRVNRAERRQLVQLADGCRNRTLRWRPAKMNYR